MKQKAMTNEQILAQVKLINRVPEYEMYRKRLIELLDESENESQEEYAAFLFAFASISNEVTARRKKAAKR